MNNVVENITWTQHGLTIKDITKVDLPIRPIVEVLSAPQKITRINGKVKSLIYHGPFPEPQPWLNRFQILGAFEAIEITPQQLRIINRSNESGNADLGTLLFDESCHPIETGLRIRSKVMQYASDVHPSMGSLWSFALGQTEVLFQKRVSTAGKNYSLEVAKKAATWGMLRLLKRGVNHIASSELAQRLEMHCQDEVREPISAAIRAINTNNRAQVTENIGIALKSISNSHPFVLWYQKNFNHLMAYAASQAAGFDTEDLLQSTFFNILNIHGERFHIPEEEFLRIIYKSIKYEAIDLGRSFTRHPVKDINLLVLQANDSPEAEFMKRELKEELSLALAQLTWQQREAFLARVEGLSLLEVADLTRNTLGGAKALIHRATVSIKRKLKKDIATIQDQQEQSTQKLSVLLETPVDPNANHFIRKQYPKEKLIQLGKTTPLKKIQQLFSTNSGFRINIYRLGYELHKNGVLSDEIIHHRKLIVAIQNFIESNELSPETIVGLHKHLQISPSEIIDLLRGYGYLPVPPRGEVPPFNRKIHGEKIAKLKSEGYAIKDISAVLFLNQRQVSEYLQSSQC